MRCCVLLCCTLLFLAVGVALWFAVSAVNAINTCPNLPWHSTRNLLSLSICIVALGITSFGVACDYIVLTTIERCFTEGAIDLCCLLIITDLNFVNIQVIRMKVDELRNILCY